MAGKRDSHRHSRSHSTTSFSDSVVVAGTSYQILEVSTFCNRESAKPSPKTINCTHFSVEKLFNEAFRVKYLSSIREKTLVLVVVLPSSSSNLKQVFSSSQTQTMTLRRNNMGQLGFHVQFEGLIADVENSGLAWQAGLRQGSRLVEVWSKVINFKYRTN